VLCGTKQDLCESHYVTSSLLKQMGHGIKSGLGQTHFREDAFGLHAESHSKSPRDNPPKWVRRLFCAACEGKMSSQIENRNGQSVARWIVIKRAEAVANSLRRSRVLPSPPAFVVPPLFITEASAIDPEAELTIREEAYDFLLLHCWRILLVTLFCDRSNETMETRDTLGMERDVFKQFLLDAHEYLLGRIYTHLSVGSPGPDLWMLVDVPTYPLAQTEHLGKLWIDDHLCAFADASRLELARASSDPDLACMLEYNQRFHQVGAVRTIIPCTSRVSMNLTWWLIIGALHLFVWPWKQGSPSIPAKEARDNMQSYEGPTPLGTEPVQILVSLEERAVKLTAGSYRLQSARLPIDLVRTALERQNHEQRDLLKVMNDPAAEAAAIAQLMEEDYLEFPDDMEALALRCGHALRADWSQSRNDPSLYADDAGNYNAALIKAVNEHIIQLKARPGYVSAAKHGAGV
jgi:hypothetical protein